MLVTKQPVLRRFWYPVIPVSHLEDGPKPFRLLGDEVVLWHGNIGTSLVNVAGLFIKYGQHRRVND